MLAFGLLLDAQVDVKVKSMKMIVENIMWRCRSHRSEVLHQSARMPSRTAQDRSEVLHQSATMPSRTAAQRGTQDRSEVLHQSARMPSRTAAQGGTQDCRWTLHRDTIHDTIPPMDGRAMTREYYIKGVGNSDSTANTIQSMGNAKIWKNTLPLQLRMANTRSRR